MFEHSGKNTLDSLLDIDNLSLSKNKLNKSRSYNSNIDKKKKIKKEKKIRNNKTVLEKIDKVFFPILILFVKFGYIIPLDIVLPKN